MDQLKDKVDYYCNLYNSDTIEIVTEGQTWDSFTATFHQTCAWIPGYDDTDIAATEEEKKEATEAARLAMPEIMRRQAFQSFSAHVSTEQNNKSDVAAFYGSYSHIRATLDYNYHSHYTRKRQSLQDSIITHFLDGAIITDKNGNICTTPTEPWIVFTAGAMVRDFCCS